MTPDPITATRHQRSYSTELVDASAIVTEADRHAVLASIITRLIKATEERFLLPEMIDIRSHEPGRRSAIRVSIQVIDEGASDTEIRRLHRLDLAAFDAFVDREIPALRALLEPGSPTIRH